ncbi:hypothetical protein [Synechococcus phage DSL-LC02]|nr:hypothetical protein [Synechococcus phage DSL-LC02]
MLEHCGCTPAKCNKTPKGKMCPKHGMDDCSMKEERDPKGPVKPYKSPEEIAKKHKVSLNTIMKQVKMGTKVEGEHTTSRSGARITALQHVEERPDYYTRLKKAEQVKEGNLHQWFKGSRSKDGKPGWVNVVTGGTCASDEPGEGTPKCVSSSKRASMSKSERLSASRRKKEADPGQQSKSGAAKPTYVSTDVKEGWSDKYKRSIDCDNPKGFSQRAHCQGRKKMQEQSFTIDVVGHKSAQKQQKIRNLATGTTNPNEKSAAQRKLSGPSLPLADEYVVEGEDKKGKSSGKKDACYHKVKARYDVWPSAYASGALVKCRQAGAKNWGNKSEEFFPEDHKEVASGKKKDEEGYMARAELDTIERAIKNLRKVVKKGDTQLPAWVQSKITKAADYIDTASDYLQSDEEVSEACWVGYKQLGMKKKGKRMVPNCVKENIDKIQQYGRTYTIILTWHGSTYKLQIFFSTPTIPSRKEVEDAIHKVYPGALLNAYMPSRIDPTKPTLLAAEAVEPRGGGSAPNPPEAVVRFVDELPKKVQQIFGAKTKPIKPVKENFAEQALAIVLDPDKEKRRKNYLLNIGVIGEDWQSVNRKDKTDGLSPAAVKAYRRENPGSKLQTAVTEKNPTGKRASRRKSFCSRMGGMKKRLTSAKTANDPDSRINKALRRWNCN